MKLNLPVESNEEKCNFSYTFHTRETQTMI